MFSQSADFDRSIVVRSREREPRPREKSVHWGAHSVYAVLQTRRPVLGLLLFLVRDAQLLKLSITVGRS